MNAPRPRGMVEQAVAEAIDAVAAPAVRAEILELALGWARLPAIPERGPDVADFVEGPLFRAIEVTLGEEIALAVCEELEPMGAMVADAEVSSVRPSVRAPALVADDDDPELIFEEDEDDDPEVSIDDFRAIGSLRSPPVGRGPSFPTDPAPRRELPRVLVASSDPSSVALLGAALGGVAYLEPAQDALGVLDGLGREKCSLVVLDCRHPSVAAEPLLAMQPELPRGSRVVLWGETPLLERQLEQLGSGIPRAWVRCGGDASAEDVAAVCRVLLA